MGRKSKTAGGNMPLTQYERTKKFVSSEYGTTSQRLAGHSQYQLGDCALSLTRLKSEKAPVLCTPSGYLYSQSAILEYLLTKTQELKEQQAQYDAQEEEQSRQAAGAATQKRVADFESSQQVVAKKHRQDRVDVKAAARQDLKRTSYWLADAQPAAVETAVTRPPPRPSSPHSQEPLKRKELWPLDLTWDDNDDKLVCHVSGKVIHTQAATAYWTDKKKPGKVVLTKVFEDIIKETMRCPTTSKKIKYIRSLQQSGTSFAASGQQVQAKKYRPTIT